VVAFPAVSAGALLILAWQVFFQVVGLVQKQSGDSPLRLACHRVGGTINMFHRGTLTNYPSRSSSRES